MKQKLREQLQLLAQKIIDEDGNFETSQMKRNALELYNQLSILEYLESQIEGITAFEIEEKKEEEETVVVQKIQEEDKEEILFTPTNTEESLEIEEELEVDDSTTDLTLEDLTEEILEDSIDEDEIEEDKEVSLEEQEEFVPFVAQNELDLFAAEYQTMPEFERKQPIQTEGTINPIEEKPKAKSLNDALRRRLSIGLNDRLAFIDHLFEGKAEDYSRVMSQINTLTSLQEVTVFLEENVKPDYNYWQDKEEYSKRLMVIIEESFG